MKLLVNLSTLGARPTGLGVYAAHCARAACAAFETELVAPTSYTGEGSVVLRSPAGIALGARRFSALRRWAWARRQPHFAGRLLYSPTHHALSDAPGQVLTIHDLIALRFPRQHPAQYAFFRHVLPRQLARCRAVFTVSETSRQDIHRAYGTSLDVIHVVPNGVDTAIFCAPKVSTEKQPFLLVVGAGFAHKNVDELLDVARLWKTRYRLVVASCRGKYRAHLEQRTRQAGLSERVEFLDYVSEQALVQLYQTCAAFVYPSKWEGFGIPPLEALACGAGVIASDIPAHREVLGEHAHFVQLGSEASWAHAFDLVRTRQGAPLTITHSPSPADAFSWTHSAERLARTLLALEPALCLRSPSTFTTTRRPSASFNGIGS